MICVVEARVLAPSHGCVLDEECSGSLLQGIPTMQTGHWGRGRVWLAWGLWSCPFLGLAHTAVEIPRVPTGLCLRAVPRRLGLGSAAFACTCPLTAALLVSPSLAAAGGTQSRSEAVEGVSGCVLGTEKMWGPRFPRNGLF